MEAPYIEEAPARVLSSRTFAAGDQFPPRKFAGYGIVAFPALPGPQSQRFAAACHAFVATLLSVRQQISREVETSAQMVTVWPMATEEAAAAARDASTQDQACALAASRYGLGMSLDAIAQTETAAGRTLAGRGPYLLAWSPGGVKGAPDALVLVMDLSGVETYGEFAEAFRGWSREIQSDPTLWEDSWWLEALRLKIRDWADRRGAALLELLGG